MNSVRNKLSAFFTLGALLASQRMFGNFGATDDGERTKLGGIGPGKQRSPLQRTVNAFGRRKHPIAKYRRFQSLDLRHAREWSRRNGVKWFK